MVSKICVFILVSGAAITDLKAWKVKNVWLVPWLAAGIIFNVMNFTLIRGAAGMIVPFLILYWVFCLDKMGAGDIKLLCICGLWMGTVTILYCMLFSFAGVVLYTAGALIIQKDYMTVLKTKLKLVVFIWISVVLWIGGIY